MKLTVFQSDKGDCLLLTNKASTRRVLIDGGMSESYTAHAAPTLGDLAKNRKKIDVVYVSHIDEDHISGVLKMLDDLVAWRVHQYQVGRGNAAHPEPKSACPPEIRGIWHNSFHDDKSKNAQKIEDLLAATATILSGASAQKLRELSERHRDMATSMTQALEVSRRIGEKELKIPLNEKFGGKLMTIRADMPALAIGSMKFFLIGPFQEDLEILKKKWNAWLDTEAGAAAVRAVNEGSRENQRDLGNVAQNVLAPLIAAATVLGRRSGVTAPNLASLMFLVEESGRSLLLTGDGHWRDILKGLEHHGKLSAAKNLHVNVLKVQHHGAEFNWKEEFGQAITADHYIFCGNGAHVNPNLTVIEAIVKSRLGSPTERSQHPKAGQPFKLWFNSNSQASTTKNNDHMRAVEKLAQKLANQSGGKMTFSFLTGSKFELTV